MNQVTIKAPKKGGIKALMTYLCNDFNRKIFANVIYEDWMTIKIVESIEVLG